MAPSAVASAALANFVNTGGVAVHDQSGPWAGFQMGTPHPSDLSSVEKTLVAVVTGLTLQSSDAILSRLMPVKNAGETLEFTVRHHRMNRSLPTMLAAEGVADRADSTTTIFKFPLTYLGKAAKHYNTTLQTVEGRQLAAYVMEQLGVTFQTAFILMVAQRLNYMYNNPDGMFRMENDLLGLDIVDRIRNEANDAFLAHKSANGASQAVGRALSSFRAQNPTGEPDFIVYGRRNGGYFLPYSATADGVTRVFGLEALHFPETEFAELAQRYGSTQGLQRQLTYGTYATMRGDRSDRQSTFKSFFLDVALLDDTAADYVRVTLETAVQNDLRTSGDSFDTTGLCYEDDQKSNGTMGELCSEKFKEHLKAWPDATGRFGHRATVKEMLVWIEKDFPLPIDFVLCRPLRRVITGGVTVAAGGSELGNVMYALPTISSSLNAATRVWDVSATVFATAVVWNPNRMATLPNVFCHGLRGGQNVRFHTAETWTKAVHEGKRRARNEMRESVVVVSVPAFSYVNPQVFDLCGVYDPGQPSTYHAAAATFVRNALRLPDFNKFHPNASPDCVNTVCLPDHYVGSAKKADDTALTVRHAGNGHAGSVDGPEFAAIRAGRSGFVTLVPQSVA